MVKPTENNFNSKDMDNTKLNEFLQKTADWLWFSNQGVLEKRNPICKVLHQFPDQTYQCEIKKFPRLDWFGCYNKQYFEIITITSEDDYFDTQSIKAWQGGIMYEYARQGIKTFIFVYFKKHNKMFAITNDEEKLMYQVLKTNLIPINVVEGNSTQLYWNRKNVLDLEDLFKKEDK